MSNNAPGHLQIDLRQSITYTWTQLPGGIHYSDGFLTVPMLHIPRVGDTISFGESSCRKARVMEVRHDVTTASVCITLRDHWIHALSLCADRLGANDVREFDVLAPKISWWAGRCPNSYRGLLHTLRAGSQGWSYTVSSTNGGPSAGFSLPYTAGPEMAVAGWVKGEGTDQVIEARDLAAAECLRVNRRVLASARKARLDRSWVELYDDTTT